MSVSFLFGYYGLGLRALNAARAGLEVAGDNIANVSTPGYARRRVELSTGMPFLLEGSLIEHGVDVTSIRRMEDRLLGATLQKEKGTLGSSSETLRGLQQIESAFGTIEGENLLQAYGRFSQGFSELAAQPEDLALRRTAIAAADGLAQEMRRTYEQLSAQRLSENQAVAAGVDETNRLAAELGDLNRQIAQAEAGGGEASPLRDRRGLVLDRLSELTGGVAAQAENGALTFAFAGGPTLVTADHALTLATAPGPGGMLRITTSGGADITDGLRGGEVGALLALRDESLPAQQDNLVRLARDLGGRANLATTLAYDLDGLAGTPLFDFTPPAAGTIRVAQAVLDDPKKLAISVSGEPGDGAGAIKLASLSETASALLGSRSPIGFITEMLSGLGDEIAQADVDLAVSQDLVAGLEARQAAVSGVSLDEEAIELIRNQRAFEAAARFIQVLNEVTEIAVNL